MNEKVENVRTALSEEELGILIDSFDLLCVPDVYNIIICCIES